ncbi:sn-glycerol-3-phosphate ABC transporter substrate-binding protein UgpB [Tistrella sp. BH-R2-4]|uniref:sn-glycerol-3-phosphate-binding periplasmic protein UgpB n=1 Tax=Tistrella arctica TaxID=3133430 RepID=A0ABU9YHH6_9PROT
MRPIRQRAAAFGLAGLALLSLSAPAVAATEFDLWHAHSPDITLGKTIARYADAFNASQSDYKVHAVFKGNYDDVINGAIAAARAGKAPAIVQVHAPAAPTVIYSKAAKPVDEVMREAGMDVDWSRYIQPVIAAYQENGRQIAMPFNTSTPLMWFNRDLLTKAGVEAVPVTWDDLEAAAVKLKAAGVECPVVPSWQEWTLIKNYAFIQDIPVATPANGMNGPGARLSVNDPKMVAHLDRLQRWVKDGLMQYQGRQWTGAHEAFYAQRCAIMLESSAGYGGISQKAKFQFGAALLPVEAGTADPKNSFIGGAGLFVMNGQTPEVYKGVAAFLAFLAETPRQVDWHKVSGYVPITLDAYEAAKAEGYYDKFPHQELAIRQLTRGTPTDNTRGIRLGYLVQIDEILNEELENIWSMKSTAAEAMDSAVNRANPLLERFERTIAQ